MAKCVGRKDNLVEKIGVISRPWDGFNRLLQMVTRQAMDDRGHGTIVEPILQAEDSLPILAPLVFILLMGRGRASATPRGSRQIALMDGAHIVASGVFNTKPITGRAQTIGA